MTRRHWTFLPIIAALVTMMACASIPPKRKAVTGLQGAETALGAIQDGERQLCDPVKAAQTPPVPITSCTGSAASIGLSTERHQQIAAALARAFDVQGRAATALQAWRAGDPPPAGLAEISKAASEALAVVKQLTAGNDKVSTLVGQLENLISRVAEIAAALKGSAN